MTDSEGVQAVLKAIGQLEDKIKNLDARLGNVEARLGNRRRLGGFVRAVGCTVCKAVMQVQSRHAGARPSASAVVGASVAAIERGVQKALGP